MTTTEHLSAPANGANDGRRRASAPGLEGSVRARVPADVDAPDRILAGLTSRQVAVLAVAAVAAYLGWHTLHRMVPTSMLVGLAVPVTGVTFALVVGRRDGLPLDVWLAHAIRYATDPAATRPRAGPATGRLGTGTPLEAAHRGCPPAARRRHRAGRRDPHRQVDVGRGRRGNHRQRNREAARPIGPDSSPASRAG